MRSYLSATTMLYVFVLVVLGCSEVGPTNPFDPSTPVDQQARSRLVGRVVAPDGFDLGRLSELAVTLRETSAADGGERITPTTDGAEAGRFAFEGVRPGLYRLDVAATGLVLDPITLPVGPGSDINLGDLRLRDQALAGARFGRLSGRVERQGRTESEHGGIAVRILGTPYVTVTSDGGAFELNAPEGLHEFVAESTGYEPKSLGSYRIVDGAVVTLPEVYVLSARPGRVTLSVSLPAGYDTPERLQRAQVTLFALDPEGGPSEAVGVATPLPDHAVLFDTVAPGAYQIEATHEDQVLASPVRSAAFVLAPAERLTLPPLEFALASDDAGVGSPPTVLTGTARRGGVVDEERGHGGIRVSVLGSPLTTLTSPDGRFSFSRVSNGVDLTLLLEAEGFGSVSRDVPALRVAEQRDIGEVVLPAQPGAVTGDVRFNLYGSPLGYASARVDLLDRAGVALMNSGLTADGRFAFDNVAAGEYAVRVTQSGYDVESRAIVVERGRRVDLGTVLLLHQSGTPSAVRFRGQVLAPGDESMAGTRVRLVIESSGLSLPETLTDDQGRFDVSASPTERYTVRADRAGWLPSDAPTVFAWALEQGGFVDPAGRSASVTLTPEPFRGRLDLSAEVTPLWISGPGRVDEVAVRVVGPDRAVDLRLRVSEPPLVLEDLPYGIYDVRFTRRGFVDDARRIRITSVSPRAEVNGSLALARLSDAGVGLAGTTLTPNDLCGLDLSGADLSGATLQGDFSREASCVDPRPGTERRIDDATWRPFDFTGARMSGTRFRGPNDENGCGFAGVRLPFASLISADLSGACLVDVDLSGANLTNATLRSARLSRADRASTANVPVPCEGAEARGRGRSFEGGPPNHAATPTGGDGAVVDDGLATDLRGAVLAAADLSEAELAGLDLRGTEFGGALFFGTSLRLTCLRGVRLSLTDLSFADLRQADAQSAVFTNSVLQETRFNGADLRQASLLSAVLERTDFSCATTGVDAQTCECPQESLDSVLLDADEGVVRDGQVFGCRTRLNQAAMSGANLAGTRFDGADLSRVAMTGVEIGESVNQDVGCEGDCVRLTSFLDTRLDAARAMGVAFNAADLRGATLREANLSNATFFPNSRLKNTVFTAANLSSATLTGHDLRYSDFQNATLRLTDFSRSDLRNVSLDGASIESLGLEGTRIGGASFRDTEILSTIDFDATVDFDQGSAEFGFSTAGYDFSGAHFVRGDISWMQHVYGLNLDGAMFGRANRQANGRCVWDQALDGRAPDVPVFDHPLFEAITGGAVTPEHAEIRIAGASMRGITGGPAPPDTLFTHCPVPLEQMQMAIGGGAEFHFDRVDLSESYIFSGRDLFGDQPFAGRMTVRNSIADDAVFEFVEGSLTASATSFVGATLRGRINLITGRPNPESKMTLDISLSDLTDATITDGWIRGGVARSIVDRANLASNSDSLWESPRFEALDLSTAQLPPVALTTVECDVPLERSTWRRPTIDSCRFGAGQVVDLSGWEDTNIVRTDLRGATLAAARGDACNGPCRTRVVSVSSGPVEGARFVTGRAAGATIFDLEAIDATKLGEDAFDIDDSPVDPANDVGDAVMLWGVLGAADASAADPRATPALRALANGRVRAAPGPLTRAGFCDGKTPALTEWRELQRSTVAADYYTPSGRAGAYFATTPVRAADFALPDSAWIGAHIADAVVPGDLAEVFVPVQRRTNTAVGAGPLDDRWDFMEAQWSRLGLSLSGTDFGRSRFRVTAPEPAGDAHQLSVDLAETVWRAGAAVNLGVARRANWSGARVHSRATMDLAEWDPRAFCEDCSYQGIAALDATGVGDASDARLGLRGLVQSAVHGDFSTADLSSPTGLPEERWRVSTRGGSVFTRLRGLGSALSLDPPLRTNDLFPSREESARSPPVELATGLVRADLRQARIYHGRGGVFYRADLRGASFREEVADTTMHGAVLARSRMQDTRFIGPRLWGILTWDAANFSQAYFDGSGFERDGASINEPYFLQTKGGARLVSLRRADFRGAVGAARVSFEGTDLRCADFRGAQFPSADFTNVSLRDADLRGADLSEASFFGATLRGARIDGSTRLPPNIRNFGDVDLEYIVDETGGQALRALGIEPSYFDRPERVPVPDCAQSP